MKTIKGDLIKLATMGEFDIIIHGCNCFNVMGAGIAKQIAFTFPQALEADKKTNFGSMDKLGTFSRATFKVNDEGAVLTVLNAYTQFGTWKKGENQPPVDYKAVEDCFYEIQKQFGYQHLRFGIPKIGAGLAGGDWARIEKIIERYMSEEDLTLVVLE